MIGELSGEIRMILSADHGVGVTLAQKPTLRFFFALSAMQLAARSLAGAVERSNPICACRIWAGVLKARLYSALQSSPGNQPRFSIVAQDYT